MLLLALAQTVALSVADGSRVGPVAALQVEWLEGSTVVATRTVPVVDELLAVEAPPAGVDAFRIAGPSVLSQAIPLRKGIPSRIILVRGATVKVPSGAGQGRLHVTSLEPPGAEMSFPVDGAAPDPLLWPGAYVAVLDAGAARPLRAERLSLVPGGPHELFRASSSSNGPSVPVRVLCKDEAGVGLRGVTLLAEEAEDPVARGLLGALKVRSGASDEDGILDLGLVPASLLTLRLRVPGRRDAMIRVPDPRQPTPEILHAVFRPYASVVYRWDGLPGGEPGYRVIAETCKSTTIPSACPAWAPVTEGRFDSTGTGRFPRLAPGWYRLWLRGEGSSLAYSDVELPWSSADPDVVEVSFEPLEWHLAGTVVDADGKPAPDATVYAAPLVESGYGPPGVVETPTRPDGSFEMTLLSSVHRVALAAESDEPPGATAPTIVTIADRTRTQERLELRPGAVRVLVRSRGSDEPLEDCSVTCTSASDGRGERSVLAKLTGPDGIVTFRGTGDAAVVVKVSCAGYSPSTGTVLEASPRTVEATIRLERSGDVALRVVDRAGRAVIGARVLVPDTSLSSEGFDAAILPAGITGPDGRLDLPGERFASLPVFVLAPGRALGISRLPGSQCSTDDCDSVVVLGPPSSFAGATASSASGKTIPPTGLVFSYAGVPLPTAVVRELAAAHDLGGTRGVVGFGESAVNVVPGLLPPGEYEVGYLVGSKQTMQIRAVPVGFLRLPASSPVDFRVHAVP